MSENSSTKNQFDIHDFYNPASLKGGTSIVAKIGMFRNSSGYQVIKTDNKFYRRRNLTGVVFNTTIVVSVLSAAPYTRNNNLRNG